jgi:hypothetical protein
MQKGRRDRSEEPSLIADAYALVFPMHKRAFRELANTMRAMSNL